MAGDWIKMRVDLAEDPAVILIASKTGLSEDEVVGKLHRLWAWADRQSHNGYAPGVTAAWLDRYLGAPGLSLAIAEAAWLDITEGGLSIPNFDRHNGQPGKTRALAARRNATHRLRKTNGPSVTSALAREEKRREEKRTQFEPLTEVESMVGPLSGTSRPSGKYTGHFEQFWKTFPATRRSKKARAFKAWQSAIVKLKGEVEDPVAYLIERASDYAKSFKGRSAYAEMPSTWLNGECWNDSPESWGNPEGESRVAGEEDLENWSPGG